jgi:hypothetical protein
MMQVCRTCGKNAGTHACNPLDINIYNMQKTIQAQSLLIKQLRQQLAKAMKKSKG